MSSTNQRKGNKKDKEPEHAAHFKEMSSTNQRKGNKKDKEPEHAAHFKEMKILVLDNYDSFVYNLAQYIGECGAEPLVYRNDEITLEEITRLNPAGIVISPGPGVPENKRDVGICPQVIKKIKKPILGVCMGHELIVHVFGGKVVLATKTLHGKTSEMSHAGRGIFNGLKSPLRVMRYHSSIASEENFPEELEITARTLDGEIFAVQHKTLPIFGLQFHPESIETEKGKEIIKNFLEAL